MNEKIEEKKILNKFVKKIKDLSGKIAKKILSEKVHKQLNNNHMETLSYAYLIKVRHI